MKAKNKAAGGIWPGFFGTDDIRGWMEGAGLAVAHGTDGDAPWGLLTPKDGIGGGGFRAYVCAHKLGGEWAACAVAEAFDRAAFPACVQAAIPFSPEGFFGPDAPARALAWAKERLAEFRAACRAAGLEA